MTSYRNLKSLIFSAALLFPAAHALAQQSAIQGTVTDPSGAAIPGVTVTVTNSGTAVSQKLTTNDQGLYAAPFLIPGTYSVRAEVAGFPAKTLSDITLDVGATVRADIQLTMGNVATTVQVSAAATLLNTETSVGGHVIDNERIVELPLDGRNYLELAQLAPNSAPADQARNSGSGAFSAAGSRTSQMNVLLDGVDNSSRLSGGQLGYEAQAVTPSVDAVQEFKVVTNNNSAEFGFRMGGTVMVQTKSGSNQMHGSLYEFLRNDNLAANNFFANRAGSDKTVYKRNQFGATTGGRIIKDKTFFFASYEGRRDRTGAVTTSSVPLTAFKQGDFSADPNPIFDPASTQQVNGKWTRTPFAGNVIPTARLDPVGAKIAAWYPDPTMPGLTKNYFYSPVDKLTNDQVDGRFDHNISDSHRFFARYSRRASAHISPGAFPFPADGGWTNTHMIANSYVGNLNSTLSPTMNNELRFGFTRNDSVIDIESTINPRDVGIKGLMDYGSDNSRGATLINVNNYKALGAPAYWPTANTQNVHHVSDQLTYVRGKHLIKVGGEFRREMIYRRASRFSRGSMGFDGSFTQDPSSRGKTGDSLADLLLGDANSGTISNIQGEKLKVLNYAAYFQDDLKLTRRLTLNLGVRWDRFGVPSFSNRDQLPVSAIQLGARGTNDFTITHPKDDSDCGCRHNNRNFAPRAGFAYQLFPSTVIRSGFGVYYGTMDNYSQSSIWRNLPPDYSEVGLTSDRLVKPAVTFAQGFPTGVLNTTTIPANTVIYNYDNSGWRPTQYTLSWFFDVQQRLPQQVVLTVSYLGNGSRQQVWSRDLNGVSAGPGTIKSRQPYPFFDTITYLQSGGNSNYNALAAKAEKRFSHGVTFLASYTYSHMIDDGAGTLGDGQFGGRDPNNIRLDRGSANYDRRHVFTGSYVYELPFGRGRKFGSGWNRVTNGILGGWQLSGIMTFRTGRLFNVTVSGNPANSSGANFADRLGNGALPADKRSIDNWFDLSAFAIPAQYNYGTAGRNILAGPGTTNEDLKIGKNFRVMEKYRIEFRAEMFNMTNTPNFGLPNTVINNANGGKISSAGNPRAIQFGLKAVF